jgi:colanic acid/amylovoran biosynthesis glycosyltransferase
MRLAYVLERYPELSQTFVEDELRELKRRGEEIEVLALAPGEHAELSEPAFEPSYPPSAVSRLAALARLTAGQPGFVAAWSRSGQPWPSDNRRLRGLARIAPWVALAAAADHLHAHFATEAADIAALLGRLSGRPHSFTGHSTDLFADDAGLRRRLEQAAFAVLVCEYDRRAVERLAPGVGVLHVVQLGVDLERLSRSTPYDPEGPVVAVGRLVPQKGLADLMSVAGELDRHVVVAGDGPLHSVLDHGPAELRGALAPDETAALIESASVLVAPSVVAEDGSRDGIPMVLKEALALGVPVVASDAVGNPEVVEDGWGALYPAGDRRALAAAVRALLERPAAEREAMGRAGRAFAERQLDLKRQTAKLRELFATSASVPST